MYNIKVFLNINVTSFLDKQNYIKYWSLKGSTLFEWKNDIVDIPWVEMQCISVHLHEPLNLFVIHVSFGKSDYSLLFFLYMMMLLIHHSTHDWHPRRLSLHNLNAWETTCIKGAMVIAYLTRAMVMGMNVKRKRV